MSHQRGDLRRGRFRWRGMRRAPEWRRGRGRRADPVEDGVSDGEPAGVRSTSSYRGQSVWDDLYRFSTIDRRRNSPTFPGASFRDLGHTVFERQG